MLGTIKTNITVIIPVKNGAFTLEKCLQSISKQTIFPETEIIILDSNSKDASKQIASCFGAKIVDVKEDEFDHGLTRNVGVQHAKGELVYFTVQDAWIAEHNMLEKMSQHFEDNKVMAVVGHQAVPHERDKNPLLWYQPFSKPSVSVKQITNRKEYDLLSSDEQKSLIAWDDVVAMYRKKALEAQPFVKTAFAEDWIWSYHALLKGWKLLRDPSLIVYHYHHQYYSYAFKLIYTVNYHFYKFFGFKPTLPHLIKPIVQATYNLFRNNQITFNEKLYWIGYNLLAKLGDYFSTANFLVRLKLFGEKSIERGFVKYCSKTPQGKQKKETE